MKRLFIAIKIKPDDNMLKQYYALRQALNRSSIKWVEPENFHLTLKFLGDTYEEGISVVNKVIDTVVRSKRSFDFEITNTGIFGSKYNPRVIWFGIHDNGRISSLGNEIIDKLDEVGFERDRQNFVPHLTVGRIKKIDDKEIFNRVIMNFKKVYLQKTKVKQVLLFESILRREGPVYNIISSHELADN